MKALTPLPEIVNRQKQRWLIYFVWIVFLGMFLIVFISSASALWKIVNTRGATSTDIAYYLGANLFLLCTASFFCSKAYGELKVHFSDDGISQQTIMSPKEMKWDEIDEIVVYEFFGRPEKFDIRRGDDKITVVCYFYRNPSILSEFLRSKVNAEYKWTRKKTR
jgi:hypothetical protein